MSTTQKHTAQTASGVEVAVRNRLIAALSGPYWSGSPMSRERAEEEITWELVASIVARVQKG